MHTRPATVSELTDLDRAHALEQMQQRQAEEQKLQRQRIAAAETATRNAGQDSHWFN